jgi:hypothetical protein
MDGTSGCFCCFLQQIINHRDLSFAEILDRRRFGERKNSQMPTTLPLFAAVLVNNSRVRGRRYYNRKEFERASLEDLIPQKIS